MSNIPQYPLLTANDAAPYVAAVPVTAGGAFPTTFPCRAFMVNTAGSINITDASGNSASLTVLAGVIYPIRLTGVASGGTASGIFALY